MPMATLRYPELGSLRHEVRLLELQPARSTKDAVVARLLKTRLSPDVEYIGLSTLLGEPGDVEYVYIDGHRLGVNANIAQALRNLRTVFLAEEGSVTNDSTASINSNGSIHKQQQQQPRTTSAPAKQPPRWLRELMRGVKSILPDSGRAGSGRNRNGAGGAQNGSGDDGPPRLRVWVESLCVNRRNAREDAQFRTHMAMAYNSAQMVVGWLGDKSATSPLAVEVIRAWDECMPREFGEPEDRRRNPHNYAPQLAWMAPVAHLSTPPPGVTDPMDVPAYRAISDFLNRPFFQRSWIIDEMASARFPAFLLGDEIVSWSQLLRLNMVNEEIKTHGAQMFPPEYLHMLDYMPFDAVYSLLRDYEARQKLGTLDSIDAAASKPRPGMGSGSSSKSNSLAHSR